MQRTSIASWEQPTRTASLPPRRVLHIEDDAFFAALVTATLDEAGMDVCWISSGRSAITAACLREFDAYLIGIGTRDMSPLAVAAELARLDARVPIILIADDPQKLPPGLNHTVVMRPFTVRTLLGAVEAARRPMGRRLTPQRRGAER